jgi:hypothetical protein
VWRAEVIAASGGAGAPVDPIGATP